MIKLVNKLIGPATPDTTLTLPWEQRTRSRLRVVLDNGQDAGLFLVRGATLHSGDLIVSEEGFVVQVLAADEALSTVVSDDPLAMARVCYHLGNRHTALEINRQRVSYRHDPVLDKMVQGLGLEVRREQAPFEPEVGAYAAEGHHHG